MRSKWITAIGLGLIVAAVAGAVVVRRLGGRLPSAGSPAYEETTQSFYRGLAQLQVGLLDECEA